MLRILQTLAPSYKNFLSALDSVPCADQTIANLIGRLVTEELRAKTQGGTDPADVFFLPHTQQESNNWCCSNNNSIPKSILFEGEVD